MMPVTAMLIAVSTMAGTPTEPRIGGESSVAFRDATTGKYGAPAGDVLREAGASTEIEAMERATLRLAEEHLSGPAGGVRVRLHGAFRSALVVDREGGGECSSIETTLETITEVQP